MPVPAPLPIVSIKLGYNGREGEIVTSLEADTWYTMVMFVSPTSSANGPFVKASASLYGLKDGEATTFYIDNMRFYTEDKFDLYTGE